ACKLRTRIAPEELDRFTDAFIGKAIETQAQIVRGGGSPTTGWEGLVCGDRTYEAIADARRVAVEGWLRRRSEVTAFQVSAAWDVWHGVDPFEAASPFAKTGNSA